MPLEIKELNIRVSVDDPAGATETNPDASPAGDTPSPALVQACVEKVLEILRTRTER